MRRRLYTCLRFNIRILKLFQAAAVVTYVAILQEGSIVLPVFVRRMMQGMEWLSLFSSSAHRKIFHTRYVLDDPTSVGILEVCVPHGRCSESFCIQRQQHYELHEMLSAAAVVGLGWLYAQRGNRMGSSETKCCEQTRIDNAQFYLEISLLQIAGASVNHCCCTALVLCLSVDNLKSKNIRIAKYSLQRVVTFLWMKNMSLKSGRWTISLLT